MTQTNPYNFNLPVDPEMAFGRQKDVQTLTNSLTAVGGNSFALIGGRRMGKTSLLEMTVRALQSLTAAPTGTLLPLPIRIDLSGYGCASVVGFFQTIGQEAYDRLADFLGTAPEPFPSLTADAAPAPIFRRVLEMSPMGSIPSRFAAVQYRPPPRRLRVMVLVLMRMLIRKVVVPPLMSPLESYRVDVQFPVSKNSISASHNCGMSDSITRTVF